jgi:hypothetical protein
MILHSFIVTALYRIADHLSLNKPTATCHPLLKHQSHLKDIHPRLMPKVSSVGAIVIESRCYLEIHPTRSTPEHSRPIPRPADIPHVLCSQDSDTGTRILFSYISKLQETSLQVPVTAISDCSRSTSKVSESDRTLESFTPHRHRTFQPPQIS